MAGSIWFASGPRFQGGIVAAGGSTFDFLESKIENGEHIAYLPACDVPFMAWVPRDGVVVILEVYFDLMLHAEGDIRFCFGPSGEKHSMEKGKATCLMRKSFREVPV